MRKAELQQRLAIPAESLAAINEVLLDPAGQVIADLLDVVLKYGSPEEINRQAAQAGRLDNLLRQVLERHPALLVELDWLQTAAAGGAFISIADYRRKVLGGQAGETAFRDDSPVTLEISACQYFEWLAEIAHRAAENGEIMPGRFIRIRNMKEQEADGDLPAFAAAMQIIGASYVEQPDTRGSDGSNIHLGGPETIIGYYGGVGQPNRHPLQWLDEYLYYYTRYGVRQVLNVNPGTVLVGYLLHRLGVDIEFKISVTLGNDNPYSALWTLLTARLFARPDGSTPLVGFNWSNSTGSETIEITAQFRRALGLEDLVRFEHHVTETWKGLVIQPYNRRAEIVALAQRVRNLGAKHEGGDPEVEARRARPSEIQDYYRRKEDILLAGEMPALTLNFFDKFDALNRTARLLTENGLAFAAARNLHR
jgi:hypothetical protein